MTMDTRPITTFLREIKRCDYISIHDKAVEDFTYNGIRYAEGYESYYRILEEKFNDFKTCVLDIAVQNKELLKGILADFRKAKGETFYDIPDDDTIAAMEKETQTNNNQSLRQSIMEAKFLNQMVNTQRYFLQEAICYLEGFSNDINIKEQAKSDAQEIKKSGVGVNIDNPEKSRLEKKLSDYDNFLTVNDLMAIFKCTRRTITNWEKNDFIKNVARTSDEKNTLGRKKRGQEKRYRKDEIMRSLVLQEKYNERN